MADKRGIPDTLDGDILPFGAGTPQEVGAAPPNILDKILAGLMSSAATLPKRAIDASRSDVQHLGDRQPLQSVGPALEAAMMSMGTGAIAGVPVKGAETVLGAGPIRSRSAASPIDAYHGSTKSIDELTPSKSGEFGPGVYFADTPGMASYFGGREGSDGLHIIRANVDLKNPFTVTKQGWIGMTKNKTPIQVQNELKQQGYDGIIGIGSNGLDKQIVPFDTRSIQPRYVARNHVKLDDNLVSIIKKYGMAGVSMLPPAAAAFLGPRVKPVDHNPFAIGGTHAMTPVDHDPFNPDDNT